MVNNSDDELRIYLRKLGWALASLPERDRHDIIEETHDHLLGRLEQGQLLPDAIAALGRPEAYGARFVDEMEITKALASQETVAVGAAVFKRVHRNLIATMAFVITLFVAIAGGATLFAAILKPFDPGHIGLWISDNGGFFIGSIDNRSGHREILGAWLYPVAIVVAAVAWIVGRTTLLGALKLIARRD